MDQSKLTKTSKMKTKSFQAFRISMLFIALALYAGSVQAQQQSSAKTLGDVASEKTATTKTIKVEVGGMSCQEGCANGLDATFKEMPGVIETKTSFENSLSEITFDDSKITEKELIAIIKEKGFTAKLLVSEKSEDIGD